MRMSGSRAARAMKPGALMQTLGRGEFDPVEETVEIEMFRLTRRMLADAGFVKCCRRDQIQLC